MTQAASVTYAQCIEARRLLGLNQAEVGKAIGVAASQVSSFETTGNLPRTKTGHDRLPRLKAFFERSGVEFVDENGRLGVNLRRAEG